MARSIDDSDSDDDFVVLGTPLPELDQTIAPKKPITVQDLTAKDKEGRRRFHGAFTGGYSAGYFNTVGSKEGFTPSTFVSSRSQKNEDAETARPEDFMDNEDLEEHGIAPRKFATVGNYTSEERKRKLEDAAARLTQSSSALELGGVLNDLVIPEYLPVGIKLLRKMGWREGQGLGPRIKKKTRKKKEVKKGHSDGKKIYGCAMPPPESSSDDSDSFIPANISDLTFAPTDVTPISLHAKDDVKGLGYHGLDPTLALPGSHINLFGNPVKGKKAGKGIRGHAFGVGALEEDDDDIYAQDSLSNYDLTMRDGEDDDGGGGGGRNGNFGWTAPRQHGKQKVPVSYVGKLLEGFCLSSKPLQPRKNFPPPKLPPNFKPRHWSRRRKEEERSGKQSKMTAVDRGLMLGETPIMNSVFDLVGSKDKSRMECAKEAIEMTKSLGSSTGDVVLSGEVNRKGENESVGPSGDKKEQPKFLSRFVEATTETINSDRDLDSVNRDTSSKSLFKGSLSLQPFRKDPAKQARFDGFLAAIQQKAPDPYGQVTNSRMTEWEKARERDEFSRCAKLYRPMSAMMSSRFVQGAMLDDKNQDSKMDTGDEVSDEVKASEMRMFGKLTREEFEWHPDKLMCKRFNVPNPYPGSDIVGLPTVKRDKYSVFNFLSFGDYRPKEPHVPPPTTEKDVALNKDQIPHKTKSSDRPEKKKATLSSIFKVLDDPDFHRPPTNSKSEEPLEPKADDEDEGEEDENEDETADVDLFRAIFKNSDSEDSEDDDKSDKKDESMSGYDDEDVNKSKDNDNDENKHSVIADSQHVKELFDPSEKDNIKEIVRDKGNKPPDKDTAVLPFNRPPSQLEDTALESSYPFSAAIPDTGMNTKSSTATAMSNKRSGSRWDGGGGGGGGMTKSVFSVLDEVNNDCWPAGKTMEIKDNAFDSEYGPVLPPPPIELTPDTSNVADREKEMKGKDRETSHRRRRDKHKHKKDKKKKSKHKSKKERKHKKNRKSSKSRRSKPESSGSDADSETSDDDTDSDVSDKELLNRFIEVSKKKSGKS